jgi:hypothetical protein
MKPAPKFKVGDRVVGVKEMDSLDMVGQIGTVITAYTSGNTNIYQVKFDRHFSGRLYDEQGLCWNCYETTLDVYDDDYSIEL